MHEISIISMFKNESSIIKCWIQHYIDEGIDHFYLIDNGSTDNFKTEIKDYMNKITLISDKTRFPAKDCYGPQQFLQNKYYLDKVKKESKWVFICDIDEYLFNRNSRFIKDYLKNTPYNYIKIPYVYFGTILKETPKNIPISLTKCSQANASNKLTLQKYPGWKSIVKTENLIKIDVHNHVINNANEIFLNYSSDLILNHYQLISEDYYMNVRCKRGGGVHGRTIHYLKDDIESFNKINKDKIISSCFLLHDKKQFLIWWKIYILNYSDLNFNNFIDSWNHWKNHGKKEKRTYYFKISNFNWKNYINRHPDLKRRLKFNKESAWEHYLNYGKRENRKIN